MGGWLFFSHVVSLEVEHLGLAQRLKEVRPLSYGWSQDGYYSSSHHMCILSMKKEEKELL